MAIALRIGDAIVERFAPPQVAAALHAVQPAVEANGQISRLPAGLELIDFRARLDNWAELSEELGLPLEEADSLFAGRIILRAYRRWGDNLVSRLRGDWWFALWDGSSRRLLLARDATGPTPLFYTSVGARFVFAPSLVDLLRVDGVQKRVCEERMASLILFWIYSDYRQTEYEGVHQLLPGHSLTLDANGLVLRRYWRPEDLAAVRLSGDRDYVEAFLALFRRAVSDRLRNKRMPGVMLSAGLDSGSVTALAAQELARRGARLPAFTHVPLANVQSMRMPGRLLDEWPLAEATAKQAGAVDHIAIRSTHLSPIRASLRGLEMTELLQSTSPNAPWLYVLHEEARVRGVDVLLNGQFGNIAASWAGGPSRIWPLLADGQWLAARRTLLAGRPATLPFLVRAVARQIRQTLRPASSMGPVRLSRLQGSLVRPQLVRKWRRHLESQVPGKPPRGPLAIRQFGLGMILSATAINGALAAAFGMEAGDPTADQRLIEFCLAIPVEQFAREGQDRRLMRRAMDGVLPPQVQWNRDRGLQTADYVYRLLASRTEVEMLLSLMQRSDLSQHYLDVPVLRRRWSLVQPTISPTGDFHSLNSALMAGLLLTRMEGLHLSI